MAKKVKIPSLRDMQKKFPGFTIASEADDTSAPWLPSRFHALNYILGGGIPYGKVLELFGSESGGKYCANYEPILTDKGWKTHGTITTEDKVIDPVTGSPTEVLKVFPKGMRDIYRVTFKNGAHVDAGAEHLWEVWFKLHGKKVSKVVTTEELMKDYRKLRASNKGKYHYKYQIITTKPLNLPTKALPIHPYILGFILGDGSIVESSSNAVRFTISAVDAQETLDRLNSYLDSNKGQYIKEGTRDETILRLRLYGFKNDLKELGLWGKDSKTKFIPSQYLYSSIDQRKELLAGLVDTDGSTCLQDKEAAHTSIKYTTHSYQLSEDIKFLVNSLGGLVYIKQGTHRNELENKLHFRLNFNPFHRGYRKKALDYQINKARYQVDLMNTLVDIKYIGQHECTCIKVNTQRGLYITRDFIVTHNTLMAYDFAYCCQYLGGVVLWADAEQSFTNTWAETNGLDLSRVVVYRETAIEKISDWIASMSLYWRSQLTHNEPILLILDSVSALDTESNINSEMTDAKADMGNRAKAIYKYFRIRNEMLYSLGITQIYINQLRTNLKAGMFENPDCLHRDTPIPFVDGRSFTIKEVVDKHIQGKVWSFDMAHSMWVAKDIKGWIKKPADGSDWYTITTCGPDTKNGIISTTVTANHKFLVSRKPNRPFEWVYAKDLLITDKLISHTKGNFKLHTLARSFLNGTIIGDSTLDIRKDTSANLHFRDNSNSAYVDWKINKLSWLGFTENTDSRGYLYYRSKYTTEFKLIKGDLGRRDPLNVLILGQPDWLTLAVWYMDDGHYDAKRHTCMYCISYARTDVEGLIKVFESYGLKLTKRANNKNLVLDKASTIRLHSHICTYIPECMEYKLLPEFRGKYKDFECKPEPLDYTLMLKIQSIEKASARKLRHQEKYDLTIEDTHNFLAGNKSNGIIVHNTTPGGAALKFYASQRIGLYGGKTLTQKIKGKERKVGKVTSIRTMKNKVAPPRFTIKASPLYNNPKYNEVGFDKLHYLDEVLIEEEIIEKSSGGVYKFGDQVIARGEEKFKKVLEENDELRRKLLRKAGINTLGATKKKLEKLTTNLYPIDDAVGSEDFEEDEEYE